MWPVGLGLSRRYAFPADLCMRACADTASHAGFLRLCGRRQGWQGQQAL
jgi:hypothetical protein